MHGDGELWGLKVDGRWSVVGGDRESWLWVDNWCRDGVLWVRVYVVGHPKMERVSWRWRVVDYVDNRWRDEEL